MRIYFCDLCNESVPQADLDEGRAVLRKGRVICARCESAMSPEGLAPGASHGTSHGAPPGTSHGEGAVLGAAAAAPAGAPPPVASPAEASRGQAAPAGSGAGAAVGIALALVALLFTAGTTAFLFDRAEGQDATLDRRVSALRGDLESARRELDARAETRFGDARDELARVGAELRDVRARVDESSRAGREAVDALRADVAALTERLAQADAAAAEAERQRQQVARLEQAVAGLRVQLDGALTRREEPAPGAQAAAPPEPEVLAAPSWNDLVSGLASDNSGDRWTAVQALGDTGDPAVAEHLTPMLRDPDIFVRMATARILGDLHAVAGIPALIDALEDAEASVREAAVVSLRAIAGREFRFNPTAKDSERAKRVKAWRDWWKKAEGELLGGS